MSPDSVFEVVLAKYPVVRLPLSAVDDPLVVTHAAARIALYREAMGRGDRFPPISVIRVFGRHLVADGHKRLAAYSTLSTRGDEIVVEVWPLSRWLQDQVDQAAAHWRKNRRMFALSLRRPRDAARLASTTVGHWQRVAMSLARRVTRRRRTVVTR
jgi:hypothetical protein